MRFLLLIISLFCCQIFGANVYVGPSATGSGTGADYNNLKAIGGSFTRGDTIYLVDGTYGAKTWNTAVSGSTLITVKKAIPSDHGTSTGWSDTMGDGEALFGAWAQTTSYWAFDGQVGGGPGSWDSGHGIRVQSDDTILFQLSGTVGNSTYDRIKFQGNTNNNTGGIKGTTGSSSTLRFTRCAVTDLYGVPCQFINWSGVTFEYCYMARNRSTAEFHAEAFSFAGINSNIIFRWSIFDLIQGTAVWAGIGIGTNTNFQIYGNIISRSAPPLYFYWDPPVGSNQSQLIDSYILNNTVVGCGPNSSGNFFSQGGYSNVTSRNNLFYLNDGNSFSSPFDHDYSFASDNIRSDAGNQDKDPEIISGEAHGQNSSGSPFVSYNADPLLADLTPTGTDAGFDTSGILPGNNVDMKASVGLSIGQEERLKEILNKVEADRLPV